MEDALPYLGRLVIVLAVKSMTIVPMFVEVLKREMIAAISLGWKRD
jgi:hypothetical protein